MATSDGSGRRHRVWNWLFTLGYGVLFVLSLPFALRALVVAPAEGVNSTAFFFMNLTIAALPFTILLSLTGAWMYHRGGAHRGAYIAHSLPVANVLLIFLLRAMVG